MNDGLKVNQIILGIHMLGNKFDTDAKGFLSQTSQNAASFHLMTRLND